MSGTPGLRTSQTTGKMPDPKKATLSESVNQWIRHAVSWLTCSVFIGFFVWMAEPNSTFDSSRSPEGERYNLLVQGFSEGHLYLKRDVPAALTRLANPYDPSANGQYVLDLGDISYYKGRLYLYFGVTPAVVLFWPYHALTGDYLSEGSAVAILFAVGFAAFLGLARAICARCFSKSYIRILTACVVILGLMTGLTISGDFYDVAIIGGFTFTMLSLVALWAALHATSKQQVLWLLLASLAYGLAVGSRPSLLFGIIILLIPAAKAWHERAKTSSIWHLASLFAASVVPAALIGLGLMLYNDLRFGSPFEFGWRYQLNGIYDQTTAHQFNLAYVWFDFRTYFLHAPGLTGHFPFLRTAPIAPLPEGYDPGSANAFGGILWRYPLALLAMAAPLAWRGGPAQTVSSLRWFVTALFWLVATSAFVLCLFFAVGPGYEVDFLPGLLFLSVIGFLALERVVSPFRHGILFLHGGGCLLLVYSLAFNIMSNVEAHAGNDCQEGNSSRLHNDLSRALVQYEDAESLWPDYPDAHFGLGETLEQQGHMNDAIAEYQKALEISPTNAIAHGDLAFCLLQTGSANDAVAEYEKAIQLDPESAGIRVALASCLFSMGRKDAAMAQYQKAVELEPTSADYRCRLGAIFLVSGYTDKAIVEFQKTTELRPDSAQAWFCLGDAFSDKGTLAEAVVAYQKGIAIQPDSAQVYNSLGNAFRGESKATNAIASYRTAIDIAPQYIQAQINLAWMLATWPDASIRNGSDAVALMRNVNELSGNNNDRVLRTLAAAYAETGQFAEAETTAKQALEVARRKNDATLIYKLQAEVKHYQDRSPSRSKDD